MSMPFGNFGDFNEFNKNQGRSFVGVLHGKRTAHVATQPLVVVLYCLARYS